MNFKKKPKAFTLVEVLVSVGVFLMTIIAISQVFITVIRSERLAYALLNSENNIRNNVELMARAIRMGTNFSQTDNSYLCFTNSTKEPQCFNFRNNNILETLGRTDFPLLDPSIQIASANFYLINNSNSQWTVVIQLQAQVEVYGQIYPFHIETAVTPRTLNI
ncbi:MAG: PilW family protein [Minisyncoccia bacterium]